MFLPKEIVEKINRKFDPSLIKKRELHKGGKVLSYIPTHAVLERLNEVFGHDVDSRILYFTPESTATDEGNIVVVVELTVRHEGTTIVKQGFGSAKVKKTQAGIIVDLGNDYKAASSDAIKKAASQLGIGLHLYDDSDEIATEMSSDTTLTTPVPVTTIKTPNKFNRKPIVTTDSSSTSNNTNPAPASEKSLNLMFKLLGEHSKTVADFGLQEGNLTQSEVSKVINQLIGESTSKPKEKVKS